MTIKINDCDTPIGCSEKSGTGFDVHLGVELLNSSTYENELDHSKLQGLHLPDQHPIGAIIDLRETLEDYDSRASILEDATNSLDARTDILENKAAATESALTTVNTTLTTHKGRLDLHETRINEFVASDGATNAEVVDARTDKDGVTYGSLGARIMQSETQLDAVEAELDLKANQTEVTAALEVKADKSELTVKADKSELTPLQTELDEHEDSLNNLNGVLKPTANSLGIGMYSQGEGFLDIGYRTRIQNDFIIHNASSTRDLETSGWYTVFEWEAGYSNASDWDSGTNFMLTLSRSFRSSSNEAHTFIVSCAYQNIRVSQVCGTSNTQAFTLLRFITRDYDSATGRYKFKIEVYYDCSVNNHCSATVITNQTRGMFTTQPIPKYWAPSSGTGTNRCQVAITANKTV